MNFPYSSLIVEAESAKQQLTRAFQTEAGGQISNLFQNGIKQGSGKNNWNEVANGLKESLNISASASLSAKKGIYLNEHHARKKAGKIEPGPSLDCEVGQG